MYEASTPKRNLIEALRGRWHFALYRVAQKMEQSIQSIFQDFALINSYHFFTLLDRASFPHYNNTKIIKFG